MTTPDLDSLTSSILYAYFRSISPPKNAFTSLYIPLLNLPASEIRLRPEFTVLFRHANISESSIVTRDDLPKASRITDCLPAQNTRWILVDHNQLTGDLGTFYGSRVHGVIDHHKEENSVPRDTEPEPRLIEKSGSCTSLIIRHFRSTWDTISDSSLSSGAGHAQSSDCCTDDMAIARGWDAQIAKFALASILEDTANLTSTSNTVEVDREMVAYLESKINLSPKDSRLWDRDQFHNEITTAKKNIEALSLQDILRKDYKMWTENGMRLGMSSVVKPLAFLSAKAAQENAQEAREATFNSALEAYIADRQLALFAILTTSTSVDGRFQRELLLQADASGTDSANRFVASATEEFGLENMDVDGIQQGTSQEYGKVVWRRTWLQNETQKGRKQIGPRLRQAMS